MQAERSMLGVFRDVAIAIDSEPVGQLATFDRMFEGIRGALKSAIQSAINNAERHLGDEYAVRVLKALFLVKYIKEFKATLRNLSVLMLERFGDDLPAQRKRLEAALNKLEQQTYIQRNGDLYEYLTDEEKDVEEEIKGTEVESTDILKELESLLFDGVIKQRKIRHSNGQDYAYTRKMDDRSLSREHELAIHIVTPLSDNFDNDTLQRMQSMGRDELRVVLPADVRFMQDLTMYKRTEKYIRQNSNTPQEAVKRILDAKGFQNTERLNDLQLRAKGLLGKATLIINAADVDVSSEEGQTRVLKGFEHLLHPKLLVGGVWCIADLEYMFTEDKNASPWLLASIKPIQLSHFDFDAYLAARKQFSTEEWIDLLIQSVGFNPQMFGSRNKLSQLVRLIPFCERNFNLIELGPKGTGKSHIFSEFSPHGILISGGEVTVPKLFVHNGTGKLGLVGYWDVVAFDEFAGKQKRVDKALVDIMKNYMANKSFSRGVETLGAEASMVFVGNTDRTVPYMLKHSDLFAPLPEKFHDSAFLDRLHSYIPGWEVDVIRGEMFSDGYGFVVDYLAEILRALRNHDFSDRYKAHFKLSDDISTRDRDGINKTFSGLMKVIYPHGDASAEEIEALLRLAIEGRKRVKDQLLRIDSTYPAVRFTYTDQQGNEHEVRTLEEDEYPAAYHQRITAEVAADASSAAAASMHAADSPTAALTPEPVNAVSIATPPTTPTLREQHLVFQENQRGVTFDNLFGPYLVGAKRIIVTDPYLRMFHQQRNLMELLETISRNSRPEDEVAVHVVTVEDEFSGDRQTENFEKMTAACASVGIQFSWAYDTSGTKHDRDITTDHGWKILLSRGLDVFQRCELIDTFNFANRMQQHRQCKEFNVTFVRLQ